MKNFSKLTNYEKINLSTKEVGLSNEQIFELHIAGVDKIGLLLTADADILAKLTDMELETAKEIKETLANKGITIDLSTDTDKEDNEDNLGKPFRLLETLVQTEILDYVKKHYERTGINIIDSNLEELDMSEDLRTRLRETIRKNERAIFGTFSARIVMMTHELFYGKKLDVNLLIAFRNYICETTSMSYKLYEELDHYSFQANIYEQIEMI